MQTYNGLIVPSKIKCNRIISAFQNEIEESKIEEYTEVFKSQMLSHEFPPILGFPSILTDEDVAENLYFINGAEVCETHIGELVWFVTDGHHRSISANNANLPYLHTVIDKSCITSEVDLKRYYELK